MKPSLTEDLFLIEMDFCLKGCCFLGVDRLV